MSTPLTDFEAEALKLPTEERARLADRLFASVYGDPEIEEAWAAEVKRRIVAVENGAPLTAADTVLVRAKRSLA